MAHVLLAAPGDLDRPAGQRLGDAGREHCEVELAPPSEAAAEESGVDGDRIGGKVQRRGAFLGRDQRRLRPAPERQRAALVERRGVHRLHGRMGEPGRTVLGLDQRARRAVRVAVIAQGGVGIGVEGRRDGGQLRLGLGRVGCCAPFDLHRLGGLEGDPGVARHHRDPVAEVDHRLDAGHVQRRGGVMAEHFAAEPRAHAHRGEDHARQRHVDAEGGGAGDLGGHVEPRHVAAEIFPFARRAQVRAARRLDPGGRLGQLGIGDGPAIGGDHPAVLGPQARGHDPEPLGRRLLQHRARRRSGHAHLLEPVDRRGGAAGDLQPEELADHIRRLAEAFLPVAHRVIGGREPGPDQCAVIVTFRGRSVDYAYILPRHVKFLGDHGGERRLHALAHLGARRDDGHPVGVDDQPRVERHRPLAGLQRVGDRLAVLPGHESDAARDRGRAHEQCAAGDRAEPSHLRPLSSHRRPRGWRRGYADRCHSGRDCRASLRRSPHRWVRAFRPAGPRPA